MIKNEILEEKQTWWLKINGIRFLETEILFDTLFLFANMKIFSLNLKIS